MPLDTEQGEYSETLRTARRLLRESLAKRKLLYALVILSMIGLAAFTGALAYSTRLIVNDVFVAGDPGAALRIAALVIGISIGKSMFQYANSVITAVFNRDIAIDYQKRLFNKLIVQDVSYFTGEQSAAVMKKVNMLGGAAARLVTAASIRALTELVILIGLGTVMVLQDPLMSLVALVLFPVIFVMVRNLSRRIRNLASTETELTGAYFAVGSEAFAGIKTVKSYSLEEKSNSRFEKAVEKMQARMLGIAKITSATVPLMEFLGGLVLGAFVIYASWQISIGARSPGEFTAFITAFLMAYQPAQKLSKEWVELQRAFIQSSRMCDILDMEATDVAAPTKSLAGVPATITFDDVSFRYSKKAAALRNVSFRIEAGDRVAIVGRSGAGKTTLIDLVQRFVQPTSGTVSIGGIDLKDVSREDIRNSVALISQEVFLFEGTIRENIRDGNPEATDEEIMDAARQAQVLAFTATMRKGLDESVGPNGSYLSGGQRQRVGIARALVKNAKVVIFDEATSALDGATEQAIMDLLAEKSRAGRTFLFVTHRAKTLNYVDRVILLDQGRLVGFESADRLQEGSAMFRQLFGLDEDRGLEDNALEREKDEKV